MIAWAARAVLRAYPGLVLVEYSRVGVGLAVVVVEGAAAGLCGERLLHET